jgi:hypothetical protein
MRMPPSPAPSGAPASRMVAPRPALGFVHPDGVELAAGGHDACLGDADAHAGDEHAEEAAAHAGCGCGSTPANARGGHHLAGTELVDQQANRNLHQCVGPEEGRQQEAHQFRGQVELFLDDGQGHGNGAAVDVVDGNQDQQQEEELPTHGGASLHAVLAGFAGGVGGGGVFGGCRGCFGVWDGHSFSFAGKFTDGEVTGGVRGPQGERERSGKSERVCGGDPERLAFA